MEEYIREKRSVSLDELCAVFDVSKNTVRRDTAVICNRSDIHKIYGGVSVQYNRIPPSFAERLSVNAEVKRRIGKCAASLVEDGDVIFVDAGTTTCQMIDFLGDKKNVTIITHSLDVITRAFAYPNLTVIIVAGTLNRLTYSFTGQTGSDILKEYNIRKAFMATTGFTIPNGATQAAPYEFVIKEAATKKSDLVYLMIESQKIGRVCLLTYATADQVDAIITSKAPNAEFMESYTALGGRVHCC
ncbi:MAG: DeoR/GlpR family DNA-binding transcription regulator [Sphaerochaeta sp.]|nr:DeoR/GlpR family DNA-binding transcription regulator [Sphaerochaeta sp.]